MATCFTSVPVRSLIVMLSANWPWLVASNWMRSTLVRSMVPPVRKNVAPPRAVTRDGDGLAAIFAAEVERVEAAAAVDDVIAVARIPDERVVAVAEERCVAAFTSDDRIVAVAAEQGVVAAAAGEHVVAVAAEQRCGGQRLPCGRRYVVERNRVVAVAAEHIDLGGVGERRLVSLNGYRSAVDENLSCRVAGDGDGVAAVVSSYREHA